MSFGLTYLKEFYIRKYRFHLIMLTIAVFTILIFDYFKLDIQNKILSFNILFNLLGVVFSSLCYRSISKIDLVEYNNKNIYFILTNEKLVRINDFLILFNIGFFIGSIFFSLVAIK